MLRAPRRPAVTPSRPYRRTFSSAADGGHRSDKREELSFALITPESLAKARTGGILARLLSTQGLRLVGARMYAPSRELQSKYVSVLERASKEDGHVDCYEQALIDWVRYNLSEAQCVAAGVPHATMFLLFKGHNARHKLSKVVGDNLPPPSDYGRTIRGTFGDYHEIEDGTVVDFHPAVLTPNTAQSNREALRLFAEYAEQDGGVLKHSAHMETGLVLIKPDNLQRASSLPGHIIDLFGTLGLQIVGVKLFSMSLNQGKNFYGFLEEIFKEKLTKKTEAVLRERLSHAFEFPISDAEYTAMAAALKNSNARYEVAKIISYMTGVPPFSGVQDADAPGPARCLGLLYRGENTINKIREKLGATDPSKAAEGTIRSDFGHDLMRNGAHASDSVANAERERGIVGMMGGEPSAERALIEAWLAESEAYKHEFK